MAQYGTIPYIHTSVFYCLHIVCAVSPKGYLRVEKGVESRRRSWRGEDPTVPSNNYSFLFSSFYVFHPIAALVKKSCVKWVRKRVRGKREARGRARKKSLFSFICGVLYSTTQSRLDKINYCKNLL